MADNKDKKQKEIWSVNTDSISGGWAPPAENYTVSYETEPMGVTYGTLDDSNTAPIDFGMDAGKGFENMKFDDFEPGKPFEDTVPTLETINKVCEDYPSLRIAYEKFKNVWRICYTDYVVKNPDEENY
jgi:hypothetical protein|tara:strand:- start:1663 stop:2046 length:384 start_codon:yes stop_codon:yes gene_type:complete